MSKRSRELEELGARLAVWRDDPRVFVREAFTGDASLPPVEPETWQDEALLAFATEDRIAVRSGRGVGKTAWLAWVILNFMLTRGSPSRVPCTAPTAHQLEDVLWAELSYWHRRLHPLLRSMLVMKAGRVEHTAAPAEQFAVARTARREQPEAFQGFHAKNMLFVIDESSGVDDLVFSVGDGSLTTPGAKVVMTGNPTRTSGYFWKAFHPKAGERRWWTRKVSCLDVVRPGPVVWAAEKAAEYGEDSNWYRVHALGEFPKQDDDVVIPLEWIEAARVRTVEPSIGPVVWGVDVARYGSDRTAVAKRMQNELLEPVISWAHVDLMQTAGRIVAMWEATHEYRRPKEILVDAIGYGAGVADRLREQGLPAKAINVSEKPGVHERYLRQRDELWFLAREWFQSREVVIPRDEVLSGELSVVRYSYSSGGKVRVESKDEMKKRMSGRSPDLADAFVLTFAASSKYGRGYVAARDRARGYIRQGRAESDYNPHGW